MSISLLSYFFEYFYEYFFEQFDFEHFFEYFFELIFEAQRLMKPTSSEGVALVNIHLLKSHFNFEFEDLKVNLTEPYSTTHVFPES